ncbi:putative neutral zinc metallopeptidase [mine drainage metagenome]|uniref:Putative neutral zinc metallopeptidase n=1 Tax=mine drainage metagenome TaxID=410659 RepID=A0A1J5PAD1_9ZZZZ
MSQSLKRVQAALQAAGVQAEILGFEQDTRTAAQAAGMAGCALDQIVKSIVFRGETSGHVALFLTAGGNQVSPDKASAVAGEALGKADAARSQSSETRANAISVRLELQADCFAGVWARAAQDKLGVLEPGDIAEAMNAASKIGDDTLQRNAGRTPMPDSFTHGTSAQRQRWFNAGYQNGQVNACDTFGATNL